MLKEAQVAGLDSEDEQTGTGDDEEWDGFDDAAPAPVLEPVDHEEEYIDEDLYTTVKIEAVSVDRDGLHNKAELEGENEEGEGEADGKKTESKESEDKKARHDHPTKKKKKFRYESKGTRQATERKIKARKAKR